MSRREKLLDVRKFIKKRSRLVRKRSKQVGLPPGALVHVGEKKVERTKIITINYNETDFQEKELTAIEECQSFADQPTVTWVDIVGLHQIEVIEKIGNYFTLHPLVLEDIVNTEQRPKMEDFDNYIYVVVKMPYFNENGDEIIIEQISLILTAKFVICFQEREGDVFNAVRERIRNGKGQIRKMGADYLLHALIDSIVDNYFVILEKIGEQIESLEEELVTHPTPQTLHHIHNLRREMILLRKSIWPIREVISSLERAGSSLVKESTNIYLRDVYDHVIQVMDTIDTLRDVLSGMLDTYLSSISNRMNEVMKVLTIIATIFIPITFVAGIYGMNFQYMPELEWRVGYFTILGVMAAIALTMVAYFRTKKWF